MHSSREALSAMVRAHSQSMYRTARAILKDETEAEDAVQEAWLLACRSIDGFRGDAKLSTWLVRIAANEALGRLRRRKRRALLIRLFEDLERDEKPVDPIDDHAERPDAAALRAETRRELERAIAELPEAFRGVFLMRAVEEATVEETAQALHLVQATVRTRYFRARMLLRFALAREIDSMLESHCGGSAR